MTLATVNIVRRNGASGSIVDTTITSALTRASTSDVASPGANNPIPIPGAGTSYSYWVTTRLNVSANPDGHTINNLKWYVGSANLPSGVAVMGRDASTTTDAGYRQATGTVGVTGTQLTTGNHTGLDGTPVDVFATYPLATPATLAGTTTSTGLLGDHFVYQISLDTTVVPASPAPANTFVFRYDEA